MGHGCTNYKLGVISQERLKIEVKLLLCANRKSYMPRRLSQQRMILRNLQRPFHGSSVPSVWDGRANINALCTSSTLKSTLSASRAFSAVAELVNTNVQLCDLTVSTKKC